MFQSEIAGPGCVKPMRWDEIALGTAALVVLIMLIMAV